MARIQALSAQGLRAVAVASRPWSGAPRDPTPEDETGLVFEGLCTFADPPKATRAGGGRAAGRRRRSGGDPLRRRSAGGRTSGQDRRSAGSDRSITGADLDKLGADALRVQARDTDVFARLSPDQKVRIVHALRAAGEVVGFMGDGVNDAPGIKAADVGLSVDGATGVARAAADMILLELRSGRRRRRGRGGPADLRQHPEVRAHGRELQLRQHALDGGGVALPAVPADAGDPDPAEQPAL